MIVRSWHGAVPVQFADAFECHFRSSVVDELRGTEGNLGVYFRRVSRADYSHFFLLTYWDGWGAIRRFAGETPHLAVTYPDDAAYGLISDPIVLHQQCSSIEPWHGEALN